MKCSCCLADAVTSILAVECDGRLYIPNAAVRDHFLLGDKDLIKELHFCHPCMRFVEDNFRASIAYLKAERGPKFRS